MNHIDPKTFDSSPFNPGAIDPATAAFNIELEAILASVPSTHLVDPAVTRAARARGEGIFPLPPEVKEAAWREIPGPDGARRVRVLVPPEVRGVYLHIHGGGWTLGAPAFADMRNWAMANACQLAVVSVEYRLGPENPWPACGNDCENAALWLCQNCAAEFGTDNLCIGGESAGAHLAATTLLRMRDRQGFTGFTAANLVYGMYDMSFTPSVANWGDRNLVLSTPIIDWFVNNLLNGHDRRDPDVSALYADLNALPAALFTVGTLDPLLDDSLFMHARWLAAGNTAELAVFPGGAHGFDAFPIELAARATAKAHDFLNQALA